MTRTIYAPGLSGPGTKTRATKWIGERFAPGWCLYWCLTQVFKVPGLGDFDRDGSADAEDYWKAAIARGKVVKTTDWRKIPAGVLIMWTGGSSDHGHAAYSLGGGEMVSTDLPTRGVVGRCSIDLPRARWGHTLVGYVIVDGNGFTLAKVDTPRPPTKLPKPVLYTVTDPNGLIGRAGPSTESKKVYVQRKGGTVQAVAIAKGDGHEWAVTRNGTHYSTKHLVKKV